ncbi:MAG: hypothetical protein ACUVXF_04170 [Desulfobaccales bacterium]
MQVTINEEQIPVDFSHLRSLEEVLVELNDRYMPPGEQLFQVRVNGEFFSERYPRESRYMELAEISRLELKTIPYAEMARLIIQEALQQADILCLAIEKSARLFRVSAEDEANHYFAQLLEALRWLLITGGHAFQVLHGTLNGESASSESQAGPFLRNLQNLLDEMLAISKDEDYILLADLMEYEMLPMVREWQDILRKLAKV